MGKSGSDKANKKRKRGDDQVIAQTRKCVHRRAKKLKQEKINDKSTQERSRRGALRGSMQKLEEVLMANGLLALDDECRKTYNKKSTKDVILQQAVNYMKKFLLDERE